VCSCVENPHFSVGVYDPTEKWGFSTQEHTPLKGLWNVTFAFFRTSFWTVPFLGLFSLFSVFNKRNGVFLLLFIPLLFVFFYFGWYGNGIIEMGSRFYLPAFMPFVLAAVSGINKGKESLNNRKFPCAQALTSSLVFLVVLYMSVSVFPLLCREVSASYKKDKELHEWLKNPPGMKKPAIVFLRRNTYKLNKVFTRNFINFDRQKTVIVLFLSPPENEKLIKSFPGRTPYVVDYNNETQWFTTTPRFDNAESGWNYYCAGLNYWENADELEKGEIAFMRSLELHPRNPTTISQMAWMFYAKEKYDKALELYCFLVEYPGYEDNYYMIGRTLRSMGRNEEALQAFEKYLQNPTNEIWTHRAQKWKAALGGRR